MPGPWENYAPPGNRAPDAASAGPWSRYAPTPGPVTIDNDTGAVEPTQSAFVGPPVPPRIESLGTATKDIAIGALDIGQNALRGMVNGPTLAVNGLVGAMQGALDPKLTWRQGFRMAQDEGRKQIEAGDTIVHDEGLRTPQGREMADRVGTAMRYTGLPQALNWIGSGIEKVAGPEARDVAGNAADLATLAVPRWLKLGAPRAAAPTAEDVAARANRGDSAGAAAAAVDIGGVSPELRAAIAKGGRRGGSVSPEALARHVEADTLPVPIQLTAGEATQDAALLSHERNLRGKHKEMGDRMGESSVRLGQNLQAMREQLGSEVFSTNPVEHGDTLIAAYKAKDAAAQEGIRTKYKALRDANGGNFPIDAPLLLDNAVQALHQQLLLDHAPKAVMATLERLAKKGSMTFENFESLRTNLARTQRSMTADGNERFAAGIIRQAMEELPMRTVEAGENLLATEGPGSAAAQKLVNQNYRFTRLKQLADDARSTARAHFQELEADPAYAAAVDGSIPPDRFVQKFVIGAPRDQVAVLMRNLGDTPAVRQTVGVAVLDHLRDAARLDASYGGNFSAAGFSRALAALDPKANILFDARTAENLGKLRNVATYTTFQPRGSFVNNSNTLVGGAAKYGGQALEGAANFAAGGVPVGTWGRALLEGVGTRRLINRSLKPGAGIVRPRGATSSTAARARAETAAERSRRLLTEELQK